MGKINATVQRELLEKRVKLKTFFAKRTVQYMYMALHLQIQNRCIQFLKTEYFRTVC